MNYNTMKVKLNGIVSRGIKAAEIDENGHLIFTLTDNTTVDLGDVTGKTAYEAAVEGGFIGTEEQFNEALGKSFDAEAYGAGTRGGEDVEAGDPAYHNNAKYYAETAESAKTGAETAKTAAESAKNAATAAKTAAENAQSAAETAKTGAVDAKGVAQLAAAAAQGHASDAGTAAGVAANAASAAITAKTAAESAKSAAQSAKTAAETAQTAAETAQSNAEAAEDAAAASAAEIEDMTVSAHLVQAGGTPTVTKTGGSGTPYNLDFGIPKGATGATGAPGEDGADGEDGYSPAVTISEITGGHRVTITDKTHQSGQSFDVLDGEDGASTASAVSYDNTVSGLDADNAQDAIDAENLRAKDVEYRYKRSLDALWKINEGQTFDFEEVAETGTNAPPTGAKFETLLSADGKSEQVQTQGRQIIDTFNPASGQTLTDHGVTFTVQPDGGIKCVGTAIGDAATFYIVGQSSEPVEIADTDTPIRVRLMRGDNASVTNIIYQNDIYVDGVYISTLQSATDHYSMQYGPGLISCKMSRIMISEGQTVDHVVYPMLYIGEETDTWEPFTGGAPSPSPDYPQPIHSVEELNITVTDADDEIVSSRTITPPRPLNAIGDYKDICDVEKGEWKYICKETSDTYVNSLQSINSYGIANFAIKTIADGLDDPSSVGLIFLSDYFVRQITIASSTRTEGMLRNSSGVSFLRFKADNVGDVASANRWLADHNLRTIYVAKEPQTEPISPADLEYLRSLEILPTDHHITITDQDGSDVSYLVEYIVKLSEVTP